MLGLPDWRGSNRGFHNTNGAGLGGPIMGETQSNVVVESGGRKQITVMFVDIVGSSALAQRTDAEDLSDWLESYYKRTAELVQARGGEVTEYLADGVVACFGLHTADELAASRAVDAALAAVAPLAPPAGQSQLVELRAGVATGEVATRSTQSRLPLATGAVTTLACRIQECARPGAVMISQSTQQLLRGGFSTEFVADQRLKGFDEAQVLYRVSSQTVLRSLNNPISAAKVASFVGRQDELERIKTATLPCLIVGEAGIGKSALTAAATYNQFHAAWLWADGLRSNSSYFPFRTWLTLHLGAHSTGLDALHAAFPSLDDQSILALALVLGWPEGQQILVQKANLALNGIIQSALCTAIFSTFNDKGVVVVEDLHWLDHASFGTLQTLLEDPRSQNLKIILTSREDFKIGTYLSKIVFETISLNRLDIGEASAMAAALAQGSLSDTDTAWLVETSGGNPLFLEQLYKRGNREDLRVPATLTDLLAERIDAAGAAKPLLQRASILGRKFRRDVLAAMAPQDSTIDAHLADALANGVLEMVGHDEWAFSHALLHQAAYHGILRRNRESLHSCAARVLKTDFPTLALRDTALVAQHHARAREFAPAIAGYLQASQQALYQGSLADAEGHARAAIDLCDSAPPDQATTDLEIGCYTLLGSVLMQSQGFAAPQVRQAFETVQNLAMASARPAQSTAPALFGSFSHAIISGDMGRSEVFCDLLGSIQSSSAQSAPASEVQLAALTVNNCKSFYAGDFAAQFDYIAQIRRIYDLARHGGMIAQYGMDVFAAAQMFEPVARSIVGQSDRVIGLIAETDAHQSLLNIPVMLPYAMIWGAVPLHYAGHHDAAIQRLRRGIETADAQGALFWQVIGRVWAGIIDPAVRSGATGLADMRQGLDTLEAIGSGIGRSYFEAHHARMLCETGLAQAAYDQSAKAVQDCAASRLLCWYPEILRLHALNCDVVGRADEAADMRSQGLAVARTQGATLWEVRLLLDIPVQNQAHISALEAVTLRLQNASTLPEYSLAKQALAKL